MKQNLKFILDWKEKSPTYVQYYKIQASQARDWILSDIPKIFVKVSICFSLWRTI